MKRIIVYTKKGCPFCSLLKMELDKRGFEYDSFDLSDDATRAEFYRNSGTTSVPQLYITSEASSLITPSGVNIGGYSDVSKDWKVLTDTMP